MAIHEISRDWVKPFLPVDSPKELPLSDLDVIQVPYHVPVIFVYRSGGSSEAAEVDPLRKGGLPTTTLLKESLARTLAAFYPLGGRIGSPSGRLAVYGFNDGVPFIEAEFNLDIPSDAHLQPSQFSSELLATPTPGTGGTPQGVPVLSVKVTRFRCGGLVLGVSFHHQIVDAAAFFTFIRAWARAARGKSPPSPSLDRTVLIGRDERTDGGPENGRPPPSSLWGSAFATWQQHATFWRAYADLRWRSLGRKQGLLRVTFPREEVARLKREANEKSSESWDASQGTATPGNEWASSDDAVCAHMWQRITRARALPGDTTVTFDRQVDMRSRLDPPLPSDYIGSGNSGPPRLSIPAGELLNKTLGQVAQRLRRDVLQIGESYLMALLSKFRSFVPHFLARAPRFGTAVRVTSWAKFSVYDADFGGGCPALVSLSELPSFYDGVVEIQQTPEGDGGLDVIVFLQEEHLARLQADPELHPSVTTRP